MRFDLVFSYWIFAWYLLYILNFTKYNPKFAIMIGILENVVLLIFMSLNGANHRTVGYFILVNTFIKLLPFYTLRHEKIRIRDIQATVILAIIYVGWIFFNNQSITGNYKLVYDSLTKNKDTMPFLAFVKYVKQKTGWKIL
jgi:hypothetical protein